MGSVKTETKIEDESNSIGSGRTVQAGVGLRPVATWLEGMAIMASIFLGYDLFHRLLSVFSVLSLEVSPADQRTFGFCSLSC